jgi:hypothetical protein
MTERNSRDILQALLAPSNDVRKLVPMKRFGIDFEIKALLSEEMEQITQQATRLVGKGKKNFDEDLFNYLTISKACVVPNWEDEKLLEALGVPTPVDAIKKRLLFGEVATLLQEITQLNGLDQSDEDEIEEIKN